MWGRRGKILKMFDPDKKSWCAKTKFSIKKTA